MAGFSYDFVNARGPLDTETLLTRLQQLDATAGLASWPDSSHITVKKNSPWLPAHVNAAQNAINAAPLNTPQITAQMIIDAWPIETKALVLALIDRLNLIGSLMNPPLATITPQAALQAVRDKAGLLIQSGNSASASH